MNLILFEPDESQSPDKSRAPNTNGGEFFLPRRDPRAVHLLKVLHKKEGDSFEAGILGGKLGTGLIRQISEQGIGCSLTLDTEPPSRMPLRLGVGFPRPIQLRRLLRDCASFGIQAVDLISTELGEKSYRDTKLLDDGGARAALIEGAVQARDTRLPELAVYPSLAEWLQRVPNGCLAPKVPGTIWVAADNVDPQGSFSGIAAGSFSSAVLAVGSERGWSSRERALLENAGFIRCSIGTRALRTETACVAAIALLVPGTQRLALTGGALCSSGA